MTKKLPLELKQGRKHIQRACVFCNEKHLQCDVGRPCQNCLKRNIGYLCRDKVRKTRKQASSESQKSEQKTGKKEEKKVEQNLEQNVVKTIEKQDTRLEQSRKLLTKSETQRTQEDAKTEDPTETTSRNILDDVPRVQSLNTLLNCASNSFFNPLIPTLDSSHNTIPNNTAPNTVSNNTVPDKIVPTDNVSNYNLTVKQAQGTVDISQLDFDSMWAGDEYMKLNDLTSMCPKEVVTANEVSQDANEENVPPMKRSLSSQLFQFLNVGPSIPKSESRPFISLESVKAASVADGKKGSESSPKDMEGDEISPYRLRQMIKTPKDLFEKKYLIKSHNYRAAYRQLLRCLYNMFLAGVSQDIDDLSDAEESKQLRAEKFRLRRKQLRYIATSIVDIYMPTFVTLTSNMIEDDLLLQEMILQRSLLEYENMAKLVNCTPICIWRRSGEICFVSNEFLSLTGFSKKAILDNKKFIIEFMDHQSVVDYYDMFHKTLAFGSRENKKNTTSDGDAVFSKCKLLVNNGFFLKCSCCWSVKRDSFNISLLIMGQFLPIFDGD